MTTAEEALPAPAQPVARPPRLRIGRRLARFLSRAEDLLNPILVKEARQAIKSRQFLISFAVLLLCGWAWTMIGVASIGPGLLYSANGPTLFMGYYVVLAVPLLVFVPFWAFRSLAAEREDRTYELLSITTLGPGQIIVGKLASALLQSVLYTSALAPCLIFTYILRGIDLLTLLTLLVATFLISAVLALAGLFVATISSEKHWQVALSVATLAGLGLTCYGCCAFTYIFLFEEQLPFDEPYYWHVIAGLLSAAASYVAILFLASRAQLMFAHANRSTALRVAMLVQHAAFTGYIAWVWSRPAEGEDAISFLIAYLTVLGVHWFFYGAAMTGEAPELSNRVKRTLPQSFLGRMFFTWFNPGAATGYVFAIANLGAAGAVAMGISTFRPDLLADTNWQPMEVETLIAFIVVGYAYIVFYLGLGAMVLRLLSRFSKPGVGGALAVQVLLVLMGTIVPLVIEASRGNFNAVSYSYLQMLNPFYTLVMIADRWSSGTYEPVIILMPTLAAFMFIANVPAIIHELKQTRVALPERVVEEERELAPPVEAVPQKLGPWD